LPASTREVVSGVVHLTANLLDASAVEPGALVEDIKTWARLVNAGGFATGRVVRDEAEAAGRSVWARLECESVPLAALKALQRMVQRPRRSGELAATTMLRRADGGPLSSAHQPLRLPEAIPFELEQPDDLRKLLRIEIEFHSPLAKPDQERVSSLLSMWDVLAEALGEPQGPDAVFEGHTRLLSPIIVEHEVIEYTPSWESLDYVVFLMLRLHESLPITRLTIE
jgi:hypothetical protein